MTDAEPSAPQAPPITWRRRLARVGILLLIVMVSGVALMVWFERSFIYFPTRAEHHWEAAPSLAPQDVRFTTDDGVTLHGWYLQVPDARATVLFFHGNGGNLSHRGIPLKLLREAGLSSLIIDYRGYGKSDDVAPDEAGLYADARAAWRHLTGPLGVAPERVVILGESLGGAPAVQLAGEVEAAGLITVCTFRNIPAMALRVVPIPLGWALRHQMDNEAKLPALTLPKLIVHAEQDEVIPFSHGQRLAAVAAEPKRFLPVPNTGHNDIWLVGNRPLVAKLRAFVDEVVPER